MQRLGGAYSGGPNFLCGGELEACRVQGVVEGENSMGEGVGNTLRG